MIIDTHAHIFAEDFDNVDEIVDNAKKNNVSMIIVGFSKKTNIQAIELGKKYHYPVMVGIHPENVEDYEDGYLENLIANNKIVGIGECGLDYHWRNDNKDLQKQVFIHQIDLSIRLHLPLSIHVRDAMQDAYDILKPYKGKVFGIMHGFSGSLEMALDFIDLGMTIGLGGPVTFKNAREPKRVAQGVPIKKFVVETDCPYLTPQVHRGKRNEPAYVRYVLEEIASIREIDPLYLERTVLNNTIKLFCGVLD